MGDTETSKLRPWQERFCWLYANSGNATASYQKARPRVEVQANSAATEAWKLLQRQEIKARVAEIQQQLRDECKVEAKDLLRHFMAIATADPNELVEYRRTCCRFCYGTDHRYQHTQAEWDRQPREKYFDERGGIGYDARKPPSPDCPECFGEGVGEAVVKDTRNLSPEAQALYAGVKVTKDGIEVKMHDQQAAAVNAAKVIGAFIDTIKVHDATLEDLMREAAMEQNHE